MTEQYTREQILAMDLRQIDNLIIARVFKRPLWNERPNWYITDGDNNSSVKACAKIPFFTKKIEATWQLVEKMRLRYFCEFAMTELEDGTWGWMARFIFVNGDPYWTKGFRACAKTAPEAICKAALLAVMDL